MNNKESMHDLTVAIAVVVVVEVGWDSMRSVDDEKKNQ